ncbi:MAG: hypothetical protein HZB92_09325 [Euryarchaeota archaeon]|nr:hypothetical protein [Euryarchaeota archaeon]
MEPLPDDHADKSEKKDSDRLEDFRKIAEGISKPMYLKCSRCYNDMEYHPINRQFYCHKCHYSIDLIGNPVEKTSVQAASYFSSKITFLITFFGIIGVSVIITNFFLPQYNLTTNPYYGIGCCLSSFIIAAILAGSIGVWIKKGSFNKVKPEILLAVPIEYRCLSCNIPLFANIKGNFFECKVCGKMYLDTQKPSEVLYVLQSPICHRCGKRYTYIAQYDRWYCHNCKEYRI